MLAHLRRPGAAVEADGVDAERLQSGQRSADLGAQQHAAHRFDGDVDEDGHVDAQGGHRPPGARDGRFGLQQVLTGLDLEAVHAAGDHRLGLHLVGVPQRGVADVTQRGQLGARPDAAQHEAGTIPGGGGIRGGPGDPRSGAGESGDPVSDAVFGQRAQVGPERVGLDAVGSGVEVGGVDRRDHVGPGDVEDLVAALQPGEIVQGEVETLQHGAHPAVGHEDAVGQGGAQISSHGRTV